MILSCNSCGKKFVVPDNAITQSGRLVQCSACGNKWKQFPITLTEKEKIVSKPVAKIANTKPTALKKPSSIKKTFERMDSHISMSLQLHLRCLFQKRIGQLNCG